MPLPGEIDLKNINPELINLANENHMDAQLLVKIVYMRQLGLSQTEISNRLGISRSTVVKYQGLVDAMGEKQAKKIIQWSIAIIGTTTFINWLLSKSSPKAKNKICRNLCNNQYMWRKTNSFIL